MKNRTIILHVTGVMVLALCSLGQAEVVWSDNFESYADQAALDAVWVPEYGGSGTGLLLNTEQSVSPTHSAKTDDAANRVSRRTTGQTAPGPGSVRIMMYDPFTSAASDSWRVRTWMDAFYSSGRWRAVGFHEGISATYYWYRTGFTGGYQVSNIPRTAGWHEFVITWGDTSVGGNGGSIYIDGQLIHQDTNLDDWANYIRIGNDWNQTADEHLYYDDVTLYNHLLVPTQLQCGDWGFSPSDINKDCYVDLEDFALIAQDWLKCSDPDHSENCSRLLP